ncbi:MAG TPA: phosphohydrolase [Caulobacteraceae bacterium]|nr:phosphohydrolase [Caulobacteraceae bacterium]
MLPASLLKRVRELHTGPDRGYHAWTHPEALLRLLPEVRGQLEDPLAVECAILLHDAVYEPARADNERRSAALARELLAGLVPAETLERTQRLIMATSRHEVPEGVSAREAEDARIFLDMDLSILGAPDDAFDAYEAGVRHEYRHVALAAFNQGRAAILERFLARDRLFLSDWGRARFEAKARDNLRRSLEALRNN